MLSIKRCSVLFLSPQNIRKQINNDQVSDLDLIRMVLLYALRYERHSSNDVAGLVNMLNRRGVSEHYRRVRYMMGGEGGEKSYCLLLDMLNRRGVSETIYMVGGEGGEKCYYLLLDKLKRRGVSEHYRRVSYIYICGGRGGWG